jgi:hypothetical protein
MPYHFGDNEYKHLVGGTINNVLIKDIEYSPDDVYRMTDGHAGKPYLLVLHNGITFQFRQFQEVINKYGDFIPANI